MIGLCECGCGQRTTIATRNHAARNVRKGEPRRFISHHQFRVATPINDRFMQRVAKQADGCWNWTGTLGSNGYGTFSADSGELRIRALAHRFAYEMFVGKIPGDLTIDHLCKNRACVNPEHMEVVTRGENTLRGDGPSARNAAATHCINGHPFEGEHLLITPAGHRRCRTCKREWQRASRARAELDSIPVPGEWERFVA